MKKIKHKKKPKKQKLTFIISKSYVLFTLVVVLITTISWYFFIINIDTALQYDEMYNLTQYREELSYGAYSEVDIAHIVGKKSYFHIVDEKGKIVYNSHGLSGGRYTNKAISLMCPINEQTSLVHSNDQVAVLRYSVGAYADNYDIIIVFDKDGNLKYTNKNNLPTKFSKKQIEFLTAASKTGATIKKMPFMRNGKKYHMIAYGYVEAIPRIKRIGRQVAEGAGIIFLFYGVMLVVFIIRIRNKFHRPIFKIDYAIEEFKRGNVTDKVHYSGIKEFEHICENFNSMTSEIERGRNEKNRMIADISHDIKTPITVVQGYAEALKSGLVPADKVKYYLDTICEKSKVINELIDTFHSYAKLESKDLVFNLEPIDICEELRTYLAGKYSEFEIRNIELDLDIPETEIIILGDSQYLRRLFENIISNSIKYNEDGIKIIIKFVKKEQYLEIYIGDNGIGITDEIAENIFEPFFMGDQSRKSTGSSGLGMSIVKKIVEKHRGVIDLVYPPEDGFSTEFKVVFKIVEK